MKKSLIALLSVIVVMLFTVSAFALHAVPEMYEYTPLMVKSKSAMVEIGGQIRVRGEINDNYSDFNDDVDGDNTRSAYDQRVRLSVKATVSPNSFGFIELEGNGLQNDDNYDWANCDAATGIYTKGNCKPAGVTLRQAYISHQTKALGFLSGFKVGHMPIALGNGIFLDHTQYGDDAIVFWLSPADGMEISLNTVKLQENTSQGSDDADAYVATFSGGFGPAAVSADITYINDNNWGPFVTGQDQGLDFWNFGVRADVNAGPAAIKADVEFQTGKAKSFAADLSDYNFSGWAALLSADVNAGPVMVTAGGAIGSGDDIDTEDEYEGFVTSLGQGERYTYLYDQKAKTSAQNAAGRTTLVSSTYANTTNTGLNNTWYLQLGASAKPIPDLKVSADVFYLRAVKEVSNATDMDKKDIGVEVDTHIDYQIDSNLVYYIEAGYLFAGDFYANVTGDKDKIDDAYSVRHGIILSF